MPAAASVAEVLAACSCGPSRACRAARPRRSSGRAPRAPGTRRAPSRPRCRRRSGRTTRRLAPHAPTRATSRTSRSARNGRAARAKGTRGRPASAAGSGVPAGWCIRSTWYGRPRVVRGCARPSTPARTGRRGHCPGRRTGLMFCLRRPAIEPGTSPGASVTEQETDARSRRFERGIPDPDHEPSNRIIRPSGPEDRRDGSTHRPLGYIIERIERPPGIRGRSRVSRAGSGAGASGRSGRGGSASGGRDGRPRVGRGPPGSTRAAATSSGSRVTVPATQSM